MNQDNYKELALDLSIELKDAHRRINQLERSIEKANKMLYRLRGGYLPEYDEYCMPSCPKCGEEFDDVPNYCPQCGVHFVHELPGPDDDYGRVKEARLYGAC